MINGEKIGVGICTCARPEMFKKLFDSLNGCESIIDRLFIVKDSTESKDYDYVTELLDTWSGDSGKFISDINMGVAKSKNLIFKDLMDNECDHIFLIEDDMLIKNSHIFGKYIETSKITGIEHLMFAYHGPANKQGVSGGKPFPRLVVDYGETLLALNEHCVGSFCYYSRESLEKCGYIDEKFKNAFDHVSHSYSLALNGFSTPYWWWSDVANSLDYIEEQMCSEHSSTINTPDKHTKWRSNVDESILYFEEKFGVEPFGRNGVADSSQEDVLQFLKIKKTWIN